MIASKDFGITTVMCKRFKYMKVNPVVDAKIKQDRFQFYHWLFVRITNINETEFSKS